jgi:hypothetical protein
VRTISTAAKKEVFASQSGAVFLSVLQIIHSTITTIYLVNNSADVVYDGNTYTGYAFKFSPPSDKEGNKDSAKLLMSNIDRSILAIVRAISTPLTVRAAVIMILPTGAISKEAGWWEFDLKDISYDAMTISGTLSFNFELNHNASQVKYNNLTFPGIYS